MAELIILLLFMRTGISDGQYVNTAFVQGLYNSPFSERKSQNAKKQEIILGGRRGEKKSSL